MMGNDMNKQKEFTGRHMLMIMIAFFGVIIAVNLTMATLANTSWTGLVVKNSYVESQKFNGVLQSSRQQDALNWKGTLSSTGEGLQFELRKPGGEFVVARNVTMILRRPATEVLDKKYVLDRLGEGTYGRDLKPAPGAWTAEINAELAAKGDEAKKWRMIYNIFIEKDGSFQPVANKVE